MKNLMLALLFVLPASCVSVGTQKSEHFALSKTETETSSSFPPCYMMVSGHDWSYDVEWEHENAHCWGWEHPHNTSDPRYVIPPKHFRHSIVGTYPNIIYPYGKTVSYEYAKVKCTGSSACMWF